MLLAEGSVLIINPKDEVPHMDMNAEDEIHFQHGETKVVGDDISIAFVFGVSPHICKCNKNTNRVLLEESTILAALERDKQKDISPEERKRIYYTICKKEYHTKLKEHFFRSFPCPMSN